MTARLQAVPFESVFPRVPASSLVVKTPSIDDVGAETADRFEWQAAMAAADGFRLVFDTLTESSLGRDRVKREIICEHHEDWIVTDGSAAEIVSAKHRDPARGAYTTAAKLAEDGGLRHLFCRWVLLEERVDCRLVTTGGIASGEARNLEEAAIALYKIRQDGGEPCHASDFDEAVSLFAKTILRRQEQLPETWKNLGPDPSPGEGQLHQVFRFLSHLRIQHSDIQRAHLPFAAPTMYAEPVLKKLNIESKYSLDVWEAVLSLFRQRMRAAGPLDTGGLPSALPNGAALSAADDVRQRNLQRRTITVDDIRIAIDVGTANPGAYQPLPRTTRTTRAAVKMEVGNCYDNSIERAEQLKVDFQAYWRERKSGDPLCGPAERSLRRLLLRIADETTNQVETAGESWGRQFWKGVESNIRNIPTSEIPAGMDSDLLLGGVSDLANRCQIWFSDRFDIDSVMGDFREENKSS